MWQFDQVIQTNSAAAEEAASTSEELTAQAAQLLETIAFFKIDEAGGQRAAKAHMALPAAKKMKAAPSGNGSTLTAEPSGTRGTKIALDNEKDFERY